MSQRRYVTELDTGSRQDRISKWHGATAIYSVYRAAAWDGGI